MLCIFNFSPALKNTSNETMKENAGAGVEFSAEYTQHPRALRAERQMQVIARGLPPHSQSRKLSNPQCGSS